MDLRRVESGAHVPHVGHQHPGIFGRPDALLRPPRAVALRALVRRALPARAGWPPPPRDTSSRSARACRRPAATCSACSSGTRRTDRCGSAPHVFGRLTALAGTCRARWRQHVLVREKLLEGGGIAAVTLVAADIAARVRRRVPILQMPKREAAPVGNGRRRIRDVAVGAAAALRLRVDRDAGRQRDHQNEKFTREVAHTRYLFKRGASGGSCNCGTILLSRLWRCRNPGSEGGGALPIHVAGGSIGSTRCGTGPTSRCPGSGTGLVALRTPGTHV